MIERDRGLIKEAVRAYAEAKGLDYEAAHARLLGFHRPSEKPATYSQHRERADPSSAVAGLPLRRKEDRDPPLPPGYRRMEEE